MRISVHVSPQLQLLILRLREVDRETKRQIRRATKTEAQPIWQEAVQGHVFTRVESLVLGKTARVAVSDRNVTLTSARIGKPLSGGLNPKTDYHVVEFGASNREERVPYEATSKHGKRFIVKRRTRRQLRERNPKGYVVYAAAADAIPRLASLWWATAVRTLGDALDGGKGA